MDTVILAAGKGERLAGIAAPYFKPLMVVNGESVVGSNVDRAHKAASGVGGRVIVVAAPDNVAPISHVVPKCADIIVQRTPTGPGAALMQGLKLVESDSVLVLMGDNYTSFADMRKIVDGNGNRIGVSLQHAGQAARFTRLRHLSDNTLKWVEHEPITDEDLTDHGMATCWVGPIKAQTDVLKTALLAVESTVGEWPIGPALNHLHEFTTVAVDTIDIGHPEVWS